MPNHRFVLYAEELLRAVRLDYLPIKIAALLLARAAARLDREDAP